MNMDKPHVQILIGVTAAVGSIEIFLSLKNLFFVESMKEAPTDYEGLQGDNFKRLKDETNTRIRYEIAGTVLNCSVLAAKIMIGCYPIIWQFGLDKLNDKPFWACWVVQIVDFLVNKLVFLPIRIQIDKSRGKPALKIKSLARGHMEKFMPMGIIGLAIMFFVKDVNPKIWFFLPLLTTFDEILLVSVKCYNLKKLVASDPESNITQKILEVADVYGFPHRNIYKDPNEKEVPEANYYALGHVIVASEKLMSLPEKTAIVLIAQEIGLYSERRTLTTFLMPFTRCIALGVFLVMTYDNDEVCKVFGFDDSPYPYLPMYLAYAYIWPVFSNMLYRVECMCYSRATLRADFRIQKSVSTHGAIALKEVAGVADKYPVFDPCYSQWMRGYPTVSQRIKNLELG